MMKIKSASRILSLILLGATLLAPLTACGPKEKDPAGEQIKQVDYVASLKLDLSSETVKQEVTVEHFTDGDTTTFQKKGNGDYPNTLLTARYLAVNTPESTGKIEEWGKAASNFTKEALKSATSIIVESDDGNWNADSTGNRYLVWVWYKPEGGSDYRNLNLELLQNGLAIASNSAQNRYGDTCMDAIAQAKALKLKVYSNEKDPDYYYGDATIVSMKELRCNLKSYLNTKVAFEGVVTKNAGQSVYVEDYDEESGRTFGIYIYYGYNLSSGGLRILSVGNRVRVVGSVQYYETGDSYQVADVSYDARKPDDPDNMKLISEGNEIAYPETTVETFNSQVTLKVGEEEKTFSYAELALGTSISMKKLKVVDAYTTVSETASNGAMTLTCEDESGKRITVRTEVLRNADGSKVTEDYFLNKTIDVKGVVEYFKGAYQIKVFDLADVVIQ
ncbi:MAG: thermonuclease family protein [Clostridia bacterium]|nr:thermonuclease family protein [Clostridia bacterium]